MTSAIKPWKDAAGGLVRWFEAMAISVFLGVAASRTDSWLLDGLFIASLLPPMVFTISPIALVLERLWSKMEVTDEDKFQRRLVPILNLIVQLIGILITFGILLIVRDLVTAELLS